MSEGLYLEKKESLKKKAVEKKEEEEEEEKKFDGNETTLRIFSIEEASNEGNSSNTSSNLSTLDHLKLDVNLLRNSALQPNKF